MSFTASELADSLRVLGTLGAGFHPETGMALAPESVLELPAVSRALFIAASLLRERAGTRIEIRKAVAPVHALCAVPAPVEVAARPAAHRMAWTAVEDQRLRAAWRANPDVAALAAAHGRTESSITSRLIRLRLLPPPTARRRKGGWKARSGRRRAGARRSW